MDSRNVNENMDDDRVLGMQAARGNREAFAALIERNYDRIHRLSWRFCGRCALAEDIAHDVCVKLARVISSYRGDSAFSTWLYRVAFTTATDRLRSAARLEAVEPSQVISLLERTSNEAPPSPEDALIGKELWDAVRNLSPKQRDAVLLVYGEDISHAEAALILGCSEKTVSWHLFEAKKRLKVVLEAAG